MAHCGLLRHNTKTYILIKMFHALTYQTLEKVDPADASEDATLDTQANGSPSQIEFGRLFFQQPAVIQAVKKYHPYMETQANTAFIKARYLKQPFT